MKFVSLDVETTSKSHKTGQVIEFGAVIEDYSKPTPVAKLPRFSAYVRHDLYSGEAEAIAMNARVFAKLTGEIPLERGENIVTTGELCSRLYSWLSDHFEVGRDDRIYFTAAGKNVGFDLRFLYEMPEFVDRFCTRSRLIDPTTPYARPDDEVPPDLATCLERAGMEDCVVTHRAVDDAMKVVIVLRKFYGIDL